MGPHRKNVTWRRLRGYCRFSLRGLLLFTVVIAVCIAVENRRHSDERTLERVRTMTIDGSARVVVRAEQFDFCDIVAGHWQAVGRIRMRFEGRVFPRLMEVTAKLSSIDRLSLAECTNVHAAFQELSAQRMPVIRTIVLTGTDIDDGDLEKFRRIKGLRILDLSECEHVHGVGLNGVPVQELSTLILDESGMSDASFAAFSRFRELTRLYCSNCDISARALREIGQLARLRELDLSYTQVDDHAIEALHDLNRLEFLGLSGTAVTSRLFATLPTLRHVKRLWIDHTDVLQDGGVDLGVLRSLHLLRIDDSQFHHEVLERLDSLVALKTLIIVGDAVDGAVFAEFRRRHPRVTVVHQSSFEHDMKCNRPKKKINPNEKVGGQSDARGSEK